MAEIKVRVGLDSSAFTAGLSRIISQLSGAASSIAGIAARAAGALAAIGAPLSVGAFAAGIKGALDYGGELSDLAARTGIAADQLAILQQAFKDSNVSAEQVGVAVNKMQKAIVEAGQGSKEPMEALAMLGLTAKDLEGLSPAEQFERISKAIAGVESPAVRAAAAMGIFGKSGAALNALFTNPQAIAQAVQALGGQAEILGRNADRFDRVSDVLGSFGVKIRGFFVGVADALLPQLERLAEFLAGLDFAGIGQKLGQQIATAVNILTNAFREGKLGELVGLSLKIAFGEAVNFLVGGLRTGLLGLAAVVVNLFSLDTINVLVNGLVGAAEKFGVAVISVFGDAIAFVSAGLSVAIQKVLEVLPDFLKKRIGLEDFKAQTFDEALTEQKETYQPAFVKQLNDLADKDLGEAGAAAGRILGRIIDDFKAVGQDFKPADVIQTQEWKDAIAALAAELNVAPEAIEGAAKTVMDATESIELPAKEKIGERMTVPDVDQFARMGLFASEGADKGVSRFMQSIADASRKTAEALTGTVNVKVTNGSQIVVATT
jgi:hypothetical protein